MFTRKLFLVKTQGVYPGNALERVPLVTVTRVHRMHESADFETNYYKFAPADFEAQASIEQTAPADQNS